MGGVSCLTIPPRVGDLHPKSQIQWKIATHDDSSTTNFLSAPGIRGEGSHTLKMSGWAMVSGILLEAWTSHLIPGLNHNPVRNRSSPADFYILDEVLLVFERSRTAELVNATSRSLIRLAESFASLFARNLILVSLYLRLRTSIKESHENARHALLR